MWDSISEWLQRHHTSKISNDVVTITYQHFYEECVKHGRFLLSKLPAKSKCGILCNDTLHVAISLCACWYANIIPIPMSFLYGEKHYRAIIDRMKPDMLITDDDNQIVDCQYNIKTRQFTGLQKMVDMDPELEDVALIMCTSGTTGLPKGIKLTGIGMVRNVRAIQSYFKVKEDDIILIPRPLYHSAVLTGEFLVGLYSGAQLIFMNQKYNPLSILSIAERTKATVLCGTPSLMNHLSKFIYRSKIKLAVNKIALSGECITVDKAQNIRKAFPDTKIFNVYGLTEASPRVSYLPCDYFDQYPMSVGIPLDEVAIKIIDDEGHEIENGLHGNVVIYTPSVMKGYYNSEKENNIDCNGGLITGDIGYKDENNFLYIISRKDDMIIKGGMNIYPAEIEKQMMTLEYIEECVVYRVFKNGEQTIGADIVLSNECSFSYRDVMKYLSMNLPEYQMPSDIHIVTMLRRNASGKVIRKAENHEE